MMPGKDRLAQVVKVSLTYAALIALAVVLAVITASFGDGRRVAPDATNAIRPAHLADGFVALSVVNEVINLQHLISMLAETIFLKELVRGFLLPPRFSY